MSLPKAIIKAVTAGTAKWAKQRKAEERHAAAVQNRRFAMTRVWRVTIREAARRVMERAYMAASANGTLPANARQIMYAARPLIQKMVPDKQLNDQYFTQVLLPDYINETGVTWNVVYDDRGHFTEPHTGLQIGLGTIAVRKYLASIGEPIWTDHKLRVGGIATAGPRHRFGAVLFVEKEGFMPLFEHVRLAERYDLAIASTKGMSVTACRELLDRMCGQEVPMFVLHDFDKAGFSILGTLRQNTRRYKFRSGAPAVIDLGLRLVDIGGLESEDTFDQGGESARRANLRANGATEEEIAFLLDRRVEVNAMTSDRLIACIEAKLGQHGVKKIVPDAETLAQEYLLQARGRQLAAAFKKIMEEEAGDITVPADLAEQIAARLKEKPAESWDAAVRMIASHDDGDAADDDGGDS